MTENDVCVRDRLLAKATSDVVRRVLAQWPTKLTAEELRIRSLALLEVLKGVEE